MAENLTPETSLVFQKEAQIQALWAVYTAVQFAYAGFGLSEYKNHGTMPFILGGAILVGAWTFNIGHLTMLLQCVRQKTAIEGEIARSPRFSDDEKQSIRRMISGDDKAPIIRLFREIVRPMELAVATILVHLIIDVCASTALLWRMQL